jgi:hypothetical protein
MMTSISWLGGLCLALGVSLPAPASANPALQSGDPEYIDIAPHVREAALAYGLPEHWIYAVIRQESAGKIGAVSAAGAMGLMQLMPPTWQRQRSRLALGNNPFEPRANILAGASYLREMYDLFGPDGFLAAYNAGPGRYRQWRDQGRPLPAETRAYVAALSATLMHPGSESAAPAKAIAITHWTSSALFAVRFKRSSQPGPWPGQPLRSDNSKAAPQPAESLFANIAIAGAR